ncbi:MAG: hypothetical protein ACJAYJ_005224 [Saprospiraceae bacterium]
MNKNAPIDFLTPEQQLALLDKKGNFRIWLYKMLLFEAVYYGEKSCKGKEQKQYFASPITRPKKQKPS